jgi:hypothetical protein
LVSLRERSLEEDLQAFSMQSRKLNSARIPPMKSAYILVLVLLCGLGATQADATDGRLMTDAEYKSLLGEVDSKLPVWEAALKKIDPAKSTVSYAVGEEIVKYRDLGLREVEYARQYAAKQRVKRCPVFSGTDSRAGFFLSDRYFNTDALARAIVVVL